MIKYNVLTVTPFFPPDLGGIADMVFYLNENLIKQGHEVSIIAPKHIGDNTSKPKEFLNNVHRINSFYLPGWPYSTLTSISIPLDFGIKIKSIMKKGKFDIVHVHAQQYPICWYAIQAANKLNIPCVLTSHGMWALDPKILGKKTKLEGLFNKLVYSRLLKKTSGVIGLTNQITDFAKQMGKMNSTYASIPNGANTKVFKDNLKKKNEYREALHLGKESIVILFLGRFEEVKGIIELASAIKNIIKNKKIEVLFVGDGSLKSQVESMFNGINRISFFPWQPSNEIHKFYIASDIFLLPSRFEGLPLTLIEAMNAGLHILYTPVGGIPEVIEEYPRKTLLKSGTREEIQNILTETISNYSSTKGLDIALNYARKFDWENLSKETIQVYDESIHKNKS